MALPTLSKDAIQESASGIFWICECDEDGVTSGTWTRFGYFSGSSFTDERGTTSQADESGKTVKITKGQREITFEVSPMQMDKDTLEFPTKTAVGKYYHGVYRTTDTPIATNHEWMVYGILEVVPSASRSSPGPMGPVQFKALSNADALTIDATGVDAGLSAAAVAADEIWSIVQVTAS